MSEEPLREGLVWISLPDRGVLRLSGEDRARFLQGLVSNDVEAATPGRAVYACLLTPQGKFLHDFFLIHDGDSLLIECEGPRRDDLMRRLGMFKLRSKIEIVDATDAFACFARLNAPTSPRPSQPAEGPAKRQGEVGADAAIIYADPRLPQLGSRALLPKPAAVEGAPFQEYDRLRIAHAIPDGSRDMEVGKAILLENNIDLLNGIAWEKGCYMGQELTARTRYRGLIKKRLVPVGIDGPAPEIGTPLIEDGREIGEMRSSAGDLGLALLRLDALRDSRPFRIGGTTLTPRIPGYLAATLTEAAEG